MEVMLGLFSKLNKKRDNLERKEAELTLQLRLLENYPDSSVYDKCRKDLEKTKDDLEDVNFQLDLLQKRRNGGSTLEPFFNEKRLKEAEKKLNEDFPDTDIKLKSNAVHEE